MAEVHYLISDASRKVDVEAHVLRYWEDELELKIPRNEMGHRFYTEFHIRLFKQVKMLKDKGYQLRAIKAALEKSLKSDGRVIIPNETLEEEVSAALREAGTPEDEETASYLETARWTEEEAEAPGKAAQASKEPEGRPGAPAEGAEEDAGEEVLPAEGAEEAAGKEALQCGAAEGNAKEEAPACGAAGQESPAEEKVPRLDAAGQRDERETPGAETAMTERDGDGEGMGTIAGRGGGLMEAQGRTSLEEMIDSGKLEQFQRLMNHLVGRAVEENCEKLSQDIAYMVHEKLLKEMDYLMRVADEKEDERFKRLDERIRVYQRDNQGRMEAAAAKLPFFPFRKKRFGRNGNKL